MHERIPSLDGNWLTLVAQVNKLQGESSHKSAVHLSRVEKRKAHSPILALGSQMRHETVWSENDLVGDEVLVFQIVKGSLLLHRENVAVPIEEAIIERVKTLVRLDQLYQFILPDYTHIVNPQ